MKKTVILASALLATLYSSSILADTKQVATADTVEESTVRNVIPDAAITAAVKTKFAADDQVKALHVHVVTVNGKVTLKGKVPSADAKDRALNIVKATNGVKDVDASELEVAA